MTDPHSQPGADPAADGTALLVIDMVNDYDHEDGALLRRHAAQALPVIGGLVDRATEAGIPVLHLNDNHELWGVGPDRFFEVMTERGGFEDAQLRPVLPRGDAPFLFKARHSAFYASALEYLLRRQRIGRLVLTGQVTEQCILYTALDAYLRHFEVVVPRDAVVPIDPALADAALAMMERNMGAEITAADQIELGAPAAS